MYLSSHVSISDWFINYNPNPTFQGHTPTAPLPFTLILYLRGQKGPWMATDDLNSKLEAKNDTLRSNYHIKEFYINGMLAIINGLLAIQLLPNSRKKLDDSLTRPGCKGFCINL